MKVFLDTNVLLDVLVKRDNIQFGQVAASILQLGTLPEFQLCMSAISVPTIAYVLKGIDPEEKKRRIAVICKHIKFLSSDEGHVISAISGKFHDIEDAMQAACAKDYGCDIILTRNTKDFSESSIPVMEPLQFLARVLRTYQQK